MIRNAARSEPLSSSPSITPAALAKPVRPLTPADMTPPPDLRPAPPDLARAHSGIGDPCMGSGFVQGTCATGQTCIDPSFVPGGYCTQPCPCPSDASCMMTAQGNFCFVDCASQADCRDGYTCNTMHVCFPSGSMMMDGVTPGVEPAGNGDRVADVEAADGAVVNRSGELYQSHASMLSRLGFRRHGTRCRRLWRRRSN